MTRRGKNSLWGASRTKYGKYRSQCNIFGKTQYFGIFDTEQEASEAALRKYFDAYGQYPKTRTPSTADRTRDWLQSKKETPTGD